MSKKRKHDRVNLAQKIKRARADIRKGRYHNVDALWFCLALSRMRKACKKADKRLQGIPDKGPVWKAAWLDAIEIYRAAEREVEPEILKVLKVLMDDWNKEHDQVRDLAGLDKLDIDIQVTAVDEATPVLDEAAQAVGILDEAGKAAVQERMSRFAEQEVDDGKSQADPQAQM